MKYNFVCLLNFLAVIATACGGSMLGVEQFADGDLFNVAPSVPLTPEQSKSRCSLYNHSRLVRTLGDVIMSGRVCLRSQLLQLKGVYRKHGRLRFWSAECTAPPFCGMFEFNFKDNSLTYHPSFLIYTNDFFFVPLCEKGMSMSRSYILK